MSNYYQEMHDRGYSDNLAEHYKSFVEHQVVVFMQSASSSVFSVDKIIINKRILDQAERKPLARHIAVSRDGRKVHTTRQEGYIFDLPKLSEIYRFS